MPVIPRETPRDEIEASLKKYYLWPQIHIHELKQNVRVAQQEEDQKEFAEMLLNIGDGTIPQDKDG